MTKAAAESQRSQENMNAEIQLLRTHVESLATGPSIILVTSAEKGDGKSFLANSLAECLARSGRKTALLDATEAANNIQTPVMLEGSARCDVPVAMSLPDMQLGMSRESIREFFDSVRSSFDFMIIDASALLSSQKAMVLSGLSDGVLLSVRIGRAPTDNDRMMIRVLNQAESNILGVVTLTPDVIGMFEAQRGRMPELARDQETLMISAFSRRKSPLKMMNATALFVFGILCFSFIGVATYETGGYRALAAVAPAPAKAFVHSIVAELKRGQK